MGKAKLSISRSDLWSGTWPSFVRPGINIFNVFQLNHIERRHGRIRNIVRGKARKIAKREVNKLLRLQNDMRHALQGERNMTPSTIRRFAHFAFNAITSNTRVYYIPCGFWNWRIELPSTDLRDGDEMYYHRNIHEVTMKKWNFKREKTFRQFVWGYCKENNTLYVWEPNP